MVNEINKPPKSENAVLGERLLASQRQLQEMQEEHRQLMQEMEALRQRATELTRITELQPAQTQRQPQQIEIQAEAGQEPQQRQQQIEPIVAITPSAAVDNVEAPATVDQTANIALQPASTSPVLDSQDENIIADTNATATRTPTEKTTNSDEPEDPEAAAYLSQKLAEIAQLKAQYKRVQNLINTTNLIEGHIASAHSSDVPVAVGDSTASQAESAPSNSCPNLEPTLEDHNAHNTPRSGHNEHEELISTMMNMFTDFTSDLRSQADGLRAERERIRALKEELLKRKRQS